VYLLVGQRGAGKSEYARKIVSQQPEVLIVSRDAILERMFGSINTDSYSGQLECCKEVMMRLLHRKLSTQTNLKLVLDCWTAGERSRRDLNQWLRTHSATKIVALYFVTPLEFVNEWFWKKPGIAKVREMKSRRNEGLVFFLEDAPACDHEAFHKLASNITSDGFDEVIRINPLEPVITL
jgi:hypothetical protein